MKSATLLFIFVIGIFGLTGCRSVWVHPDWEEGKYESDLSECSAMPNWKACMIGRGWETEFGWRWSDRSGPD